VSKDSKRKTHSTAEGDALSCQRVDFATKIIGLVDEPLLVRRICVLPWGGMGRSGILMFDPKNTGLMKQPYNFLRVDKAVYLASRVVANWSSCEIRPRLRIQLT
jgi:hypothetical protein